MVSQAALYITEPVGRPAASSLTMSFLLQPRMSCGPKAQSSTCIEASSFPLSPSTWTNLQPFKWPHQRLATFRYTG